MRVEVRLFASPREEVGSYTLVQELPTGATVETLRDALLQAHPGLTAYPLKFAVNRVYASLDTELHDGDEVACIPPVGGG